MANRRRKMTHQAIMILYSIKQNIMKKVILMASILDFGTRGKLCGLGLAGVYSGQQSASEKASAYVVCPIHFPLGDILSRCLFCHIVPSQMQPHYLGHPLQAIFFFSLSLE